MADKQVIKIGHLKISDHLILGVTNDKLQKGEETFQHCTLEPVLKYGWNEVADALAEGSIDGAFVLAPTAMDLYKSGVGMKLILFTHKSGSVLVKNKTANIKNLKDFKGKVVLIPYQLSVHNMLFHKLLAEVGLKPGTTNDPEADVFLEVMAPSMMPEAVQYDEEGEIGGFIVAEPIGTQAIASGFGEEICLTKDLWPNHPCCVFVVRDEVINNHADAIHEITSSLVKSGLFIEEKPAEAAKVGAAFLGQDEEVMKKVLSDPPDRISTGELYPVVEGLEAIQNYMCDNMKIMKTKIDLAHFVDTRFAEAAGAK
ncbi:MAG: ABC transporter substrate-binding protein [Desulfobacterales bacterium]|nr:ABC transporter substrate-binding protein [Desulfobacterales bacterium]MCP4159002.1 ABC transporter substrate-binding protein [Deltaproteobacteria bacterium]